MTDQPNTSAGSDNGVDDLSFEAALEELEAIVRKLEAGEESLDASIALYQRGEQLKKHCEARLKAAREKIEQITLGADGQPTGTAEYDAG
ncbi:exodeoxyribonuclease VII small subunit [Sphingomicrobium clamense]|uniref:Exodeoxyribonuclease 7 small subunit n=1 Tax=Sphingomicrobium clamense TaxID=2851013 RepID=A0ABS6V7M4_9SPHN|nr:exodeoxyribonuclease VII small subunit [Sphingomicrobium sp. B8]MBW0145481.1 exodeoxyribonuclease VII small subunit [Sphingomicrobium sp. B8]